MKLAILVEGLFSYDAGHLRNQYGALLRELGYNVLSIPWTSEIPLEAELVMGHSFGASRAIKDMIKTDLLITFDAREWAFWRNSKYEKPEGAAVHWNFYQRGFFKGHK